MAATRAGTDVVLGDLTGSWGDEGVPFVGNFLILRLATQEALSELRRGKRVVRGKAMCFASLRQSSKRRRTSHCRTDNTVHSEISGRRRRNAEPWINEAIERNSLPLLGRVDIALRHIAERGDTPECWTRLSVQPLIDIRHFTRRPCDGYHRAIRFCTNLVPRTASCCRIVRTAYPPFGMTFQ